MELLGEERAQEEVRTGAVPAPRKIGVRSGLIVHAQASAVRPGIPHRITSAGTRITKMTKLAQ